MKLSHYSAVPVGQVASIKPESFNKRLFGAKPSGFWVSVDGKDDWLEWCKAEGYLPHNLAVRNIVTLSDTANILTISTDAEFDAFSVKYLIEPEELLASKMPAQMRARWQSPDWSRIATEYHGIIIAPYFWSRRLGDQMWYYIWDCASGCIWDASAIKSIEVDPKWTPPKSKRKVAE